MNRISVQQALQLGVKKRRGKYRHRAGSFTLTANFRDDAINRALIGIVGRLGPHFSQKAIAQILGCGVSTVGKMVRVHYHMNPPEQQP